MARVKNYINNKTLYENMVEHIKRVENGENPQISKYIGESILLICKNLAVKPNFSGYTYKDDMINDAILDCVAAVNNFNPDKTNNPFAYFTQIAWNAYLRRIAKEKKQTYIKHKNFENSFLIGDLADAELTGQQVTNEYSADVIRNFEDKLTKTKKSDTVVGLENFINE